MSAATPTLRMRAQALWAQFTARPPREQWLLVGALLAALLWAGDRYALAPALIARKAALAREATLTQALSQAQEAAQAGAQGWTQARQQREAEAAALRQALAALGDTPAAQASGRPADAARTLALLEGLVQRQQGQLSLRALRADPDPASLAGAPTQAAEAPASEAAAPRLYRHGLTLVVAGPYGALQQYLRDVAAAPLPLRVRGLSFTVTEHPAVELTLDLETLSPHAAWLTL
jgi:MSHA biogenesis protein MshJ